MRALLYSAALILLCATAPTSAQSDPAAREQAAARAEAQARVRSLESQISRINAEQQSVYQQFQMVQEMRRNEWQETNAPQVFTPPSTPPNYDDVQRDKQARDQRLQSYTNQMNQLYARYRELDQQKQQLLEELDSVRAQ